MIRKFLIVFIVGLLGGSWASAQLPDASFEHYTTDQGLGSDFITSICKDRRGFLWVGTTNGLSRFDGMHFKTFRRQNTRGALPGNYIVNNGVVEDSKGFLWISTNKGLCRLDPIREEFLNITIAPHKDTQADNDYTSPIVFDRAGYGWFSSKYNLYCMEALTLQLKAFPVPAVFDNSYITPLIDQQGRFWINQQGKLYRFNPRSGHYLPCRASRNGRIDTTIILYDLFQDGPDELLAIGSQGIWRYEPSKNLFLPYSSLPSLGYRKIMRQTGTEGEGIWWLGLRDGELSAFLPSRSQTVSYRHSLYDPMSHNGGEVTCFYLDSPSGILWIGTDRGLEKIDPYSIKFKREVLEHARAGGRARLVTLIRQDLDSSHADRYWITVREGGLFQWNRSSGGIQAISFGSKDATQDAYSAVQDKRGRVWVGMAGGVGRYTPHSGKSEFLDDFLAPGVRKQEAIVVTFVDREGRVWLGAKGEGLFWYDPNTDRIRRWPLPAPAGLGFVRRIQQDKRGKLWVLTGAGLYRINIEENTATPVQLHGAPVQPTDRLHSTFSLDSRGWIWMSGIGFVAQVDASGKVNKTYTLENGLRAEHVFSIQEDRSGNLWMATDDQLHVLNPRTGTFTYYDRSSGLIEKMVFGQVELTINREGELFAGYRGGFNFVRPEALRPNPVAPPVAVTEIRVNNLPRPLTESILLEPGETSLTVQYAALNFSQGQKNQYAYRLEGFDNAWVPTRENAVSFTNLNPGRYTLRIRAANNDGVWNETGVSLPLEVLPAYWQTGWFRVLGVALLAALVFLVFRYRENQRWRLESIRNRIATDLHDDMGSTLSSIRIFSDVVQQQIAEVRPEAVPIMQRISSSATNLSESMQDIVWTIQSNHDSLADLVTRMREFGLKMAEARGITFEMQVGDAFESLKLDLEQRRNMYLIFKESINNTIKYAQATRLDVQLKMQGRDLVLTILDNGKGFDPEGIKPGNGLANLHKRAREINGRMIITSAIDEGTYVEMRLKL